MKAKEYFDKYGFALHSAVERGDAATEIELANKIFFEMRTELINLAEVRHVKTSPALRGVILETNDKWNAVCRLFEKRGWKCPLLENAIMNTCIDDAPEVKEILKR